MIAAIVPEIIRAINAGSIAFIKSKNKYPYGLKAADIVIGINRNIQVTAKETITPLISRKIDETR